MRPRTEIVPWQKQIEKLIVQPASLVIAMEAALLRFDKGNRRYEPDRDHDSRG